MSRDNRRSSSRRSTGQPNGQVGYISEYHNGVSPYASVYGTPQEPQQKKSSKTPFIILIVLLLLAGLIFAGAYFFILNPAQYNVNVNGSTVTVNRGATVQSLFDEGLVATNPGDLIAVDGSVYAQGGGEQYNAQINSTDVTAETELYRDARITVTRGDDVHETFTTTTETIPAGWYDGDTSFAGYWNGSIHLLTNGQDGVRVVKRGDISGIEVVESETPAIDGGYHIYTANTNGDKVIALTFDDGPWPDTTSAILDILEQYNAKATFFTIGYQIANYPDQIRRARDMGCLVCTHTYDHAGGSGQGVNITYMSPDEQVWEITQGYAAIAEVLGSEPEHLIRAPGGNFYGDTIVNLWPYVHAEFGWDVDTEDWRRPGVDSILNMILSVQPGQIILMHDGGGDRSQTVEALRQAMPILVEQGYRFVTVADLLDYGLPH